MIGVLDWGIGGLWAVQRLRERAPSVDGIYLSDAGNVPYGKQSPQALRESVHRAVSRLHALGAERVVVACHSASTSLDRAAAQAGVSGVIEPLAVPLEATSIAVIGGERTIRSQAWRRALSSRARVHQRIAQPLSAAVEAGRASHPETLRLLRRILAPVRHADTIVLACTHYAALASAIQQDMPHARVVDPALWVADRVEVEAGTGTWRAFTTGEPSAIAPVVARVLPELASLTWTSIET